MIEYCGHPQAFKTIATIHAIFPARPCVHTTATSQRARAGAAGKSFDSTVDLVALRTKFCKNLVSLTRTAITGALGGGYCQGSENLFVRYSAAV